MIIYVRVKEALASRKMTQKQLADITGIRTASISELANNMRTTINRDHLIRITEALGITDIRDIMEIR
jgi:DNA-binding Xre family transcriptional regulator